MRKIILIQSVFAAMLFCVPLGVLAQGAPSESSSTDYRIDGADVLRIVTWKEPGLSMEKVLVRSDGKITFPLLYDIQAAGSTPFELAKTIESGLKKFLEDPYVTVHVEDPQSKKFYILGEVMGTGEYPLIKPLTVLQAFAIAGGFTEWASKKEIILLRNEGGAEKVHRINYKKIVNGEDIGQNLTLRANDTIIVP